MDDFGVNIIAYYKRERQRQIELEKDHKRRKQQGRNEACKCGSGKKFKRCCGGINNYCN